METKKRKFEFIKICLGLVALALFTAGCSGSGGGTANPLLSALGCPSCGGLQYPIGTATGSTLDAIPATFQMAFYGSTPPLTDPTVSDLRMYSGPFGVAGVLNLPLGMPCNIVPGSYSITTLQPGIMQSGMFSNLAFQASGPEALTIEMYSYIVDPSILPGGDLLEGGHMVIATVNGMTCNGMLTF